MKLRAVMTVPVMAAITVVGLSPGIGTAAPTTPDRTQLAPVSVDKDAAWHGVASTSSGSAAAGSFGGAPAGLDAQFTARAKASARQPLPATGAVALPAPRAGSEAVQLQAATPLIFNGLDRPSAANNSTRFNPPDTILGKSPNRILEGANSALRLYDNAGSVLQTSDLNTFFGAAVADGRLFDPKVYYDRNSANPRFFVVALQTAGRGDSDATNDISRIWIAVARSVDPANLNAAGWCRYNLDGRRDVDTADQSWADYPAIGAGRDSFSFSTNQFRFTNDSFTFAIVRVWDKAVASNNAASCPSVPRYNFQPSTTAGDFSRFAIQPAQHYTSPSSFPGSTNPAYYLSTTRGSSNQYHVFRVRNVADGSPTMQTVTLTGTSYSIPADHPQPDSTVLIDTGDDRMLQAAGIGNNTFGALTTACNFTSGTANESCTLTPRITVGDSGGALTASIAENRFTGFGDDVFVHHPSVAANQNLASGATWLFGGADRALSSTAQFRTVNTAWTGVTTYASGSCSAASNRSGDYTGAQTDPGLVNFWLAGEQNVTISGTCQWRNRIAELTP